MTRRLEESRRPLSVELDVVSDHPAAERFDRKYAAALAGFVLAEEGAGAAWAVTLALVDDGSLQSLHARFLADPTVTDVMTFPRQADGVSPATRGGEIVISLDRAFDQGPEHGLDGERETVFLFVHGLLHLLGWDDATADQREAMLKRQEVLIQRFDALGDRRP